jgi:hypothetical protein
MIKDVLLNMAGQAQMQNFPGQMPMPQQMMMQPNQPVMMDQFGQQQSGIRQALMDGLMRGMR